jgi:hypothetical protein
MLAFAISCIPKLGQEQRAAMLDSAVRSQPEQRARARGGGDLTERLRAACDVGVLARDHVVVAARNHLVIEARG